MIGLLTMPHLAAAKEAHALNGVAGAPASTRESGVLEVPAERMRAAVQQAIDDLRPSIDTDALPAMATLLAVERLHLVQRPTTTNPTTPIAGASDSDRAPQQRRPLATDRRTHTQDTTR